MLGIVLFHILESIVHNNWLAKTLHRCKHFISAFTVALEGHLLLVFVYPNMYPVLNLFAKLTGFHLDGFYYGGH